MTMIAGAWFCEKAAGRLCSHPECRAFDGGGHDHVLGAELDTTVPSLRARLVGHAASTRAEQLGRPSRRRRGSGGLER